MSGFRWNLSFDRSLVAKGLVGIKHWQECLIVQEEVVKVEPLLNAVGGSRKSEVDESVVRRGGGHLCPWELYAYIDGTTKACRMTTGMTDHGDGKLHVYCRQLPAALDATAARAVFFSAAKLLEETAATLCAPAPPPKPTRPPPTPPAEPQDRFGWQQVRMDEYRLPSSNTPWFHNSTDDDFFVVATDGVSSRGSMWRKYVTPEGNQWWANSEAMRFFYCRNTSANAAGIGVE